MARLLDEIDLIYERIYQIEENERKREIQQTKNIAICALSSVVILIALMFGKVEFDEVSVLVHKK